MRRILLMFIILALFPLSALCETGAERLPTLDILSQRDSRLTEEKYFYRGMSFSIAGCRPASITNALLALLGTPQTNAPALLLETMYNFSTNSDSTNLVVSTSLLPARLKDPLENSLQLQDLLSRTTGVIDLSDRNLTPAQLLNQYFSTREDHPLVLSKVAIDGGWPWLLEMSSELCRQGHPDARFVLCTVGAGNDQTDAPFASGASGHYITLYFTAGEFYEEGTFYLLDSLPRALPGDIYGLKGHYPARYPFTLEQRPFAYTYEATRLTDPVMMFTRSEFARNQLATATETSRTAILSKQVETIILYGYPYFMLYIP